MHIVENGAEVKLFEGLKLVDGTPEGLAAAIDKILAGEAAEIKDQALSVIAFSLQSEMRHLTDRLQTLGEELQVIEEAQWRLELADHDKH